ncbi:MAG: hypothetical protein DRG66_02975, partial [Deltaproteobacteria bacterium]
MVRHLPIIIRKIKMIVKTNIKRIRISAQRIDEWCRRPHLHGKGQRGMVYDGEKGQLLPGFLLNLLAAQPHGHGRIQCLGIGPYFFPGKLCCN